MSATRTRRPGPPASCRPARLRVETLEDRTAPHAAGYAGPDLAAGVYTPEQLAAWEMPIPVPNFSTKTPPLEGPLTAEDGGHQSNTLTFVLDFKKPGEAATRDIFDNVITTFDITEYGFAAGQFDALAQAILAEVDQDYFAELAGTAAGPVGHDMAVDFRIGNIGQRPAGLTNYYFIQIGTGTTGPHTGGTLGVAGGSVVRNEGGTGPNFNIRPGDVVGSVFTDAIATLGGLTPANALETGNFGFTAFAVGGTLSHEIGHTLSLSHINKAGSAQPTPGLSPLMGTGAIDLPNQDRITEREFSLSGFDGQDFNAPRAHIQQLATAVGLHLTPNDPPVNVLPSAFLTSLNTVTNLAGLSVADPDGGAANVRVSFSVTSGKLNLNTVVGGGVTAGQVTGNNSGAVVVTAPLAAVNATLAAVGGLAFTPAPNAAGVVSLTMTTSDLGSTGSGGAKVQTDVSTISVLDPTPEVVVEIIPAASKIAEGTPVTRLGANFAGLPGGFFKGVAITAVPASTAVGRWEFSVNGGLAWGPVPATVSEATAMLLSDAAANRVRFKPGAAFVGFAPRLVFKAWDQSSGASGDLDVNTVGGAAFSAAVEQATAGVGKTVPAIDLDGNPQLSLVAKDAANPPGDMVKNLLGLLANDVNGKATLGIAVTDAASADGKWQYLAAGKWFDIGSVSDTAALLLGPTSKVRFLPNSGFAGSAALGYQVWDQSVGKVGERAVVAGTAFSAAEDAAEANVVVRPVLSLATRNTLAPPLTRTVASLLTGVVSDAGTDPVGIAVTGLTGKGKWSYQVGGFPAVAITSATLTSAVLLPADAFLICDTSAVGFAGATLSFKAWNGATQSGRAGDKANATGLAFSTATETLTVANPAAAPNDPPEIGSADPVTLKAISEDPKLNAGFTVQTLVTAAKITDPNPADKKGVALTAASVVGDWQYSADAGKTWANVGAVSPTAALVLASTAKLRFVPGLNFAGAPAVDFQAWDGTVGTTGDILDATAGPVTAFSSGAAVTATLGVTAVNDTPTLDNTGVKFLPAFVPADDESDPISVAALVAGATDFDAGTVLGLAVTAAAGPGAWRVQTGGVGAFAPLPKFPALLGPTDVLKFFSEGTKSGLATLTYQAWDQSTGIAPSKLKTDALSKAKETLTVAVGNDVPNVTGPGTLTGFAEDAKTVAGNTVSQMLGTTFTGTAVGKKGIAVTNTASSTVGEWQYSTDAGRTWKGIFGATPATALLLADVSKVRFLPSKDHFGTATITYTAWDQTVGAAGETIDTTLGTLNSFGGSRSATVTVTGVTDAPTLDTTRAPVLISPTAVSAFLAGAVSSPESATFGIAVTGLTGNGTWQVNTGAGFVAIAPASATAALLLPATAVLKFVPAAGFKGNATLTYKAWDRNLGGALFGVVNTTLAANKTFFSTAVETLTFNAGNGQPSLTPL